MAIRRERAKRALKQILEGGAWHDGHSTVLAVRRSADCSLQTALRALAELGGEIDHHGRGGSRWRIR